MSTKKSVYICTRNAKLENSFSTATSYVTDCQLHIIFVTWKIHSKSEQKTQIANYTAENPINKKFGANKYIHFRGM